MKRMIWIMMMAVVGFCFQSAWGQVVASGGNEVYNYTTNGIEYRVHVFTNSGTFELSAYVEMDVLVIGGGGGGGHGYYGGGGGAGRLLDWSGPMWPGNYPVVVGAGGDGATDSSANASNGEDSTFNDLIALGGGGGASRESGNASSGGSGGGAAMQNQLGGAANDSQGGFGHAGSDTGGGQYGGGGGGAGEPPSWPSSFGGDGGDGLQHDITGSALYYAGGGGGGGRVANTGGGDGGLGGGGDGGAYQNGPLPTPATPNTGGGGGGGGDWDPGADGGSGIVIVRYIPDDASDLRARAKIISHFTMVRSSSSSWVWLYDV